MTLSQSYPFNASNRAKNRVALAPMTNTQSHADGTASSDEIAWLQRRAEGEFGITITCASHVSRWGQGWPGQMGIFSDALLPGLTKVALGIRKYGSLGFVQLHHGGIRALKELTGEVPRTVVDLEPSKGFPDGGIQLTEEDIEGVIHDFIQAALRAEKAGFAGVELHGAHGYLLAQFFDRHLNQRHDGWGGTFENRLKIWLRIVRGIRNTCGSDFLIAVRFSPENYGSGGFYPFQESLDLVDVLIQEKVDLLHASLWDVFKKPSDPSVSLDTNLKLWPNMSTGVALMVAGKIWTIEDAEWAMQHGADFVALGKVAIGNPDWPRQLSGRKLQLKEPPYDPEYLKSLNLGDSFIEYLRDGQVSLKKTDT